MSTEFWVGPAHDPDRIRLGPAAASGAEGVLYRGFVDLAGGPVALAVKMLHPGHLARLAEWTARWREQVRLLREVEISGLVAVRGGFVGPLPHAMGRADDTTTSLYLVMDWVEGVSLDQWARSLVDPQPEQLLLGLVAVAAALDLLHSGAATGGQPVVHRDVKPANILVRPEGDTVLVDLGSVRGLLGGKWRASLVGTAGYIAPEVLADGKYGPAADRYSLGAVAYFLLTGEEPPARPEPGEHRARLLAAPMVSNRTDLADHVVAMLDPDPGRRPECLANWVAQLRRSSLIGLPGDVTLPRRAPGRQPPTPPAAGEGAGPGRLEGQEPESPPGRPRRWAPTAVATRGRVAALVAIAVVSIVMATIAAAREGDSRRDAAPGDGAEVLTSREDTTTTSAELPTTASQGPTTLATAPGRTVTPTTAPAPAVRPTAPANTTSTARATPPAEPQRYRASPVITATNGSYVVEVLQSSQAAGFGGAIRRQDL